MVSRRLRFIRKAKIFWILIAVGVFQGLLLTWILPDKTVEFQQPKKIHVLKEE